MSAKSELGHLGERVEAVLNGSLYPNPNDRREALKKAMNDKPVEGAAVHRDMLTGRVFSEVV